MINTYIFETPEKRTLLNIQAWKPPKRACLEAFCEHCKASYGSDSDLKKIALFRGLNWRHFGGVQKYTPVFPFFSSSWCLLKNITWRTGSASRTWNKTIIHVTNQAPQLSIEMSHLGKLYPCRLSLICAQCLIIADCTSLQTVFDLRAKRAKT